MMALLCRCFSNRAAIQALSLSLVLFLPFCVARIEHFNGTTVNSTSISLTWNLMPANIFPVYLNASWNHTADKDKHMYLNTSSTSLVIGGLKASSVYVVTLKAVFGGIINEPPSTYQVYVSTGEDAPSGPPEDLEIIPGLLADSFTVIWKPISSCCANGIILGYNVTLSRAGSSPVLKQVFVQKTYVVFRGLQNGNYDFTIFGKTAKGDGPSVVTSAQLSKLTAAGNVYKDAVYFQDFETVTNLTDPFSGQIAKANGYFTSVPSPWGLGIKLTGGWVELGSFINTCLYRPGSCPGGLTVSFLIRFPVDIYDTETFLLVFGNRDYDAKTKGFVYHYKRGDGFKAGPRDKVSLNCLKVYKDQHYRWWLFTMIWPQHGGKIDLYRNTHRTRSSCEYESFAHASLALEDQYTLGRAGYPLTAHLDNLAVWNRALNENEISDIVKHMKGDGEKRRLTIEVQSTNLTWNAVGAVSDVGRRSVFTNWVSDTYAGDKDFIKVTVISTGSEGNGIDQLIRASAHLDFNKVTYTQTLKLQTLFESKSLALVRCHSAAGLCTTLKFNVTGVQGGYEEAVLYFDNFVYLNDYELRFYEGLGVIFTETKLGHQWDVDTSGGFPTSYFGINVKPCTNYTVRVFARSYKGDALVSAAHQVLTPEGGPLVGPVILEADNTSFTSIYVRWNSLSIPREKWNAKALVGFSISWKDSQTKQELRNDSLPLGTDRFNITQNVRPFATFTVSVAGRSSSFIGAKSEVYITTPEDVPYAPPASVQLKGDQGSLLAKWEVVPITQQNGIILGYNIFFWHPGSGEVIANKTLGPNRRKIKFIDLMSSEAYSFRINAFTSVGVGPYCQSVTARVPDDIDECALNQDDCHADANCDNTNGSFICTCRPGFTGDGNSCQDIDECGVDPDACDDKAICNNTVGSFNCTCHVGYTGNGVTCTDIDECATGLSDCSVNARCTNNMGSFQCNCVYPFIGDGKTCDTAYNVTIMSISKDLLNPTIIRHSDKYHWQASTKRFPPNVVQTSWSWCLGDPAELNMSAVVNGKVMADLSSWKINRNTIMFGTFFVKLIATVMFRNGSSPYQTMPLYDYGFMEVVRSPLQAKIKGGTAILWPFNETVTANGSLSYDPDVGNHKGLSFRWSCRKVGKLGFSLDCFGAFTSGAESSSVLTDTSKLTVNASYVIRLVVSDAGRNATDEQNVTVVEGNFPRVELRCFIDCGKLFNPSAKLRLATSCTGPACTGASYEWQLYIKDALGLSWSAVSNLREIILTSLYSENIAIKDNSLLMGREYRLKVSVKSLDGFTGFALHEFRTATKPRGGTCVVTPTSGVSLKTIFSFDCEGWNDETPPLIYQFRYESLEGTHVIVGDGPSSGLSTVLSPGHAGRNNTKKFEIIITNFAGASAITKVQMQVLPTEKLNFCLEEPSNVARTLGSLVLGKRNLMDSNLKDGNVGVATEVAIAVLQALRRGEICTDKLSKALITNVTHVITRKLRNIQTNDLHSFNHLLSVEAEAMTPRDSFCKRCVASALNSTKKAIDMLASVVEDVREPENTAVAENIVSVVGKVLEVTSQETNSNSTKEATDRGVEQFHETASVLLTRTVPGEDKVTITSGRAALTAQRTTPRGLQDNPLVTGNTSVTLPDMMNTTGGYEHVDVQMLSLDMNPYRWASNSQDINSSVVSIELKDPGKRTIPVAGLSQEITITIPTTPKAENKPTEKNFAKPGTMTYHQIDVKHAGTAVKLNLKPEIHAGRMAVFVKHNGRPSLSDYGQNFTIPDISKCASRNMQNCSRGDPYSITVVSAERGILNVGMYYLGKDNGPDEHSRRKRSCFGHRRHKRSCVGLKDPPPPPPKGFNKTVVPVYDPRTDANYTLSVSQTSCLYWSEEHQTWTSAGCKAGESSSASYLTCRCNHLSSFGGNVVVAPNPIDFDKVFVEFTKLGESGNVAVLVTICGVFGLYFVVVFFARREDQRDQAKVGPPEYLNDDGEYSYEYELVISTGVWRNSGTTSNISITIKGTEGDFSPIFLSNKMNPARVRFARGNLDPFIVIVPESIGQLTKVVVSHDDSGVSPAWFLENIAIRDRQTGEQWIFHADRWLALEKGDGHIKVNLPFVRQQDFSKSFKSRAPRQLMESHMWLSVATKVSSSTFTRVQRASCCLSVLFCAMVTNAMFYNMSSETDDMIQLGPLKFSLRQIVVGVQSGLIVAPVNILIAFLFKNVRPLATKASTYQGSQEDKAPLLIDELRQIPRGLPHVLVYVAWFLCIGSALAAAAFTFFYSLMWGKEVSEQWLSSIMISIAQDIILLQPSKAVMLIAVVVLALTIRRKGHEDAPEEDDPHELSSEDVLSEDDPKNYEMEKLRKRKTMKADLMQFAMDLLWHLLYMFLLAVVCYGHKDENRFLMTTSVKQALPYFNKATHPQMFHLWTKRFFIPSLYAGHWYNGQKETQEVYIGNKKSILVGMPRMRQLRALKEPCSVFSPHEYCCYEYSSEREDKTKLSLPGWRSPPPNISYYVALNVCPEPWRYHSDQELDSLPIWGTYHLYEGGGYPARMGYDAWTAERVLDDTIPKSWIDRQTRVVVLEFTIFNANTNLISLGSYLYEVLATGHASTRGIVETLTLYSTDSAFRDFYLMCRFLFLIIVFVLLVKQFIRMYRQRLSYFRSLWNWVELLQIIFSVSSLAINILGAKSMLRSIRKIQKNPYANVGFQGALLWAFWEDAALSLAIFFATFKLLHVIRVNPHILIMSSSLKQSFKHLFSFFFVFFLIFFSYAQSGMLIFGHGVEMYSTFPRAVVNQFEFLLGKAVPLEGLQRENRILGPVFSFAYMGTMTVLLMNFFIAIINDSYEDVREDVEERADEVEMANYMNEKLVSMVLSQNRKRKNRLLLKKLFCDEYGASMCVFEAEASCINSDNIIESSLKRLKKIESKASKLERFYRFADEDMTNEDTETVSLLKHVMTASLPIHEKVAILSALKEF